MADFLYVVGMLFLVGMPQMSYSAGAHRQPPEIPQQAPKVVAPKPIRPLPVPTSKEDMNFAVTALRRSPSGEFSLSPAWQEAEPKLAAVGKAFASTLQARTVPLPVLVEPIVTSAQPVEQRASDIFRQALAQTAQSPEWLAMCARMPTVGLSFASAAQSGAATKVALPAPAAAVDVASKQLARRRVGNATVQQKSTVAAKKVPEHKMLTWKKHGRLVTTRPVQI